MTKEEFEGWLAIRPTQEVKKYLNELKNNYVDLQHQLLTNCNDPHTIALQAVRLEGMITGVNAIIELSWEDVGGEDDDGNSSAWA